MRQGEEIKIEPDEIKKPFLVSFLGKYLFLEVKISFPFYFFDYQKIFTDLGLQLIRLCRFVSRRGFSFYYMFFVINYSVGSDQLLISPYNVKQKQKIKKEVILMYYQILRISFERNVWQLIRRVEVFINGQKLILSKKNREASELCKQLKLCTLLLHACSIPNV